MPSGTGEYARALAFSDSLIRTAEHHPVAGVHFTDCYKERADMFRRLHRDLEACMAYARAVKVRDSLLRLEQSKVIREKQESYELDRMALDAALLTAHHHKTALAYVSAGTAGDRCGRRCDLCRQPPYPATAEGVTPANEARPRKRTQKGRIRQLGLPRSAYAAQLHHGILRAALRRGDHPESRAQYCEIIRDNRRQLRSLFDDMLEVAYLENLRAAAVPVYEPLRRMPGATADHEGEVP